MNRPQAGPSRPKPPVSRLTGEIISMMALFGHPNTGNLDPTAKTMESYIRTALTALIARAKAAAQRRTGLTSVKPTPEDYLFCLRESPGLVARLSDYLSWKDIRKKSSNREHQEDVAAVDGIEEVDIASIAAGSSLDRFKQQQLKIALHWDFNYVLADALSYFDQGQVYFPGDAEWTERLRAMDELTQSMSREEYLAFSESRKASFTYNKGKRFKEFLAYHTLLDVQPSDEIVDILSFLAYELVGYYTTIALQERDRSHSRAESRQAGGKSSAPSAPPSQPRKATRRQQQQKKYEAKHTSSETHRHPEPHHDVPTGPFSMPLEKLSDKSKAGEQQPMSSEHLNRAVQAHGVGLNLITPKSGGYGFGNFGGPGKRRKLV